MTAPFITVVGSVNLDIVATGAALPAPGETVTGATLARHPGGKGANQALAARRLGAEVRLVARVGSDPFADEALHLLREGGVDLSGCQTDDSAPTGVALIAVSADGENQIVVASGANEALTPERLPEAITDALICQLELPVATVARAVDEAQGFVCINLAPALDVPVSMIERADLIVANEAEAAFYGNKLHRIAGLLAVTSGARGARLYRRGEMIAAASPPPVAVVDTTAAGDTFAAALTVALLEGQTPQDALAFACAAGAATVTRCGAQSSLPWRAEVEAILKAKQTA